MANESSAKGSARLWLSAGIVALVWAFVPALWAQPGSTVAYVYTTIALPADVTSATIARAADNASLGPVTLQTQMGANGQVTAVSALIDRPDGQYQLTLEPKDPSGSARVVPVRAVGRGYGYLAGLAALLLIFAVPYYAFPSTGQKYLDPKTGQLKSVSPWYFLLSEASGGYSLARVQLLIWFVPALVIYVMLGLPVHQFVPVPDTMWVLLGLSGATTLLGTAASQPQAGGGAAQQPLAGVSQKLQRAATAITGNPPASQEVAAAREQVDKAVATLPAPDGGDAAKQELAGASDLLTQAIAALQGNDAAIQQVTAAKEQLDKATATLHYPAPNWADVISDFDNQGDMSRYQYLLLTLVGATIFLGGFLQNWQIPDIPQPFLYLIGASQATYLGVKGVKKIQAG